MKYSIPNAALLAHAALFLAVLGACSADRDPSPIAGEVAAWEARAQRVEILRDSWGIPHIYAPTDADAVFGLMYAQAEDDFPRIEHNFLVSQGRLAEAEGASEIWRDLRMRLFVDPEAMQALYAESPGWLRDLMDAWADGLNYFLYRNPDVRPQVLDRFEPWMALTFSEGSIGGDIERVNLRELEAFYEALLEADPAGAPLNGPAPSGLPSGLDDRPRFELGTVASALVEPDPYTEPRGSNGIAIAPERTRDGHALLLINPHTSHYFRHEAHVVSEEGLNVYGALTWGQFFVYQGFNETAGWMHTSSGVDNIDEFLETIVERDGSRFYRFGTEERAFETREVTLRYRTEAGDLAERTFPVFRTHRGPVVREVDGRWVSVAMMENPMGALIQSYQRTRAANLDEFLEVMRGHTNSSNNTLFADAEGNIAYLHANFIPIRDARFDYAAPVDGRNPATDWQGIHTVEDSPNSINPETGWAFCTNNWPYSASGSASPRPEAFPSYMDRRTENPRGVHALALLEDASGFTLELLQAAAYSPWLPVFEDWLPPLIAAWERLVPSDSIRSELAEPIALLRNWDRRWDIGSIPTSVAIFWATEINREAGAPARAAGMDPADWISERAPDALLLETLHAALRRLEEDFGDWRTPWGEINRFQRLTGDRVAFFDDEEASFPVGFTSARWGSLAAYGSEPRNGTRRWYGTTGNSFVAVVEFGPRLRATAITAGGLSNDPASPHFSDQAERYAAGELRPVLFYRDDVEAGAVRRYRPGQ
jgi:acyl-homoserine-lactone acylase